MIIVRLMGGLGNQMFQYAFGLYTALNNKTVLKVDTTLLKSDKESTPENIVRNFELEIFDIHFNHASSFETKLYNGSPGQSIVHRAFYKALHKVAGVKLYVQNAHDFDESQLQIKDNTCLVGRWQSERYFKTVEDIVRQQFKFRNDISDSYTKYKNEIQQEENPVCLHIRRTDYVNNPFFAKVLGALPDHYFTNAVEKIRALVRNPKFFVFSDDTAYAKSIFDSFELENDYVLVESAKPNAHDELQLMSLCRHFIISNSTFSWWGAWLAKNEDKVVLAPEIWSKDASYSSKYILPDSYHLIGC